MQEVKQDGASTSCIAAGRGVGMSQKPHNAPEEKKRARKRKKKTKQTITRAVTQIRLIEANPGKLEVLDQVVTTFQALCQQYVIAFCAADAAPDGYADPFIATELSERYQRVAIQQAAGIARSWRTNRQAAYDAYLDDLTEYAEAKARAEAVRLPFDPKHREPEWREWNLPELRVPCIQANCRKDHNFATSDA